MKCKRCNRKLTSEKSIKRGYGIVCYRKERAEQTQKLIEKMQTTIFDFLEV